MFAKFLKTFGAALVLAPMLGACQQELVLVTDVNDFPLSTRSFRGNLAENGGVGLVVINGPAMPSKSEVDAKIASLLKVTGRSDIPVTPIADSATSNRIVLVFSPPRGGSVNIHRICSGNVGPLDTHVELHAMRIYGALCATDRVVSHGMTLSAEISPMDPRFKDIADAMMAALFPHHPKGDRGDCAVC